MIKGIDRHCIRIILVGKWQRKLGDLKHGWQLGKTDHSPMSHSPMSVQLFNVPLTKYPRQIGHNYVHDDPEAFP